MTASSLTADCALVRTPPREVGEPKMASYNFVWQKTPEFESLMFLGAHSCGPARYTLASKKKVYGHLFAIG